MATPSDGEGRYYRVIQVAELLRVPKSTVYSWITARLLAHYKIGGVVLIGAADLDAFLAEHRVEARPPRAQDRR